MGFIKNAQRKAKLSAAEQRKLEELLHEIVDDEMRSGDIKRGLWTKALAEADGDQEKARAKYIPLRVQSLTDEMLLASDVLAEAEKRQKLGNVQDSQPVPLPETTLEQLSSYPTSWWDRAGPFGIVVLIGFSVLVFISVKQEGPWRSATSDQSSNSMAIESLAGLWERLEANDKAGASLQISESKENQFAFSLYAYFSPNPNAGARSGAIEGVAVRQSEHEYAFRETSSFVPDVCELVFGLQDVDDGEIQLYESTGCRTYAGMGVWFSGTFRLQRQ